ncbi:DNA polymerase III subunit delta [Skermanella mucosa]|uniref:DNA polymerase III subunit delta n=1 Tax=Skermanella mucosa TaxID=1789672 RepID=UPI00192AC397|nr:DNA polymerase III subunit delta [Skermanella mucosa]UEM21167.1 DNA polymerase III subunit delta [Skermanella mucosa]
MKIPAGRIEGFVRRPDPNVRAVLFYGPDGGLVRERADTVSRGVVEDQHDPFRVVDMLGSAVAKDPARLADEVAAMSLTGGRRLIRIRDADDGVTGAFASLFESLPGGDSMVVVEAGDLSKGSKLRALFENAPAGAPIPCYVEDESALADTIAGMLAAHKLTVSADARDFLAANLVGDRMIARGEVEKLVTYMGEGGRRVELEDAQACIGDSGALEMDAPSWAAGDGDFAGVDRALRRLFAEGMSPVPILRSAQRHFQRLQLVVAQVEKGDSVERAVATLRPPLFFKVKNQFTGQVRRWTPAALRQGLDRLTDAEADCKRTNMPDETICARAFFQLAVLARSRR